MMEMSTKQPLYESSHHSAITVNDDPIWLSREGSKAFVGKLKPWQIVSLEKWSGQVGVTKANDKAATTAALEFAQQNAELVGVDVHNRAVYAGGKGYGASKVQFELNSGADELLLDVECVANWCACKRSEG